ncbi:MAG TPA: glycosyltransferase family 4 protein [Bryobacteraceae bacterium]|jgi:glycosyltransferase involved in cell wall biosynthesis|nr:glycosyltransferase family 4 protein [Bryobacteraceae bacterium]
MRVLHLDAGKEMRGGQWQVLRLIEGLARAGVQSTLLARPASPLFAAAHARGWRVEPLGYIRAAFVAARHHVIHAHDARSHTMAAVFAGPPLVVARRVAFPIRSRWKYRRANRYIAVSEYVKSVLLAGGVPERKISVVYDGVPVLEPRAESPAEPGGAMLTPANTADPAKGSALAAEAARLAGVELTPSANLEADLPRAGALVYISHSEGLGSAALLAMAAGVPVIASRVGGLPEIVRDGETGLLVENDAAAIAGAMRRLACDPALARRMGEAARRSVIENFTVDRMVHRTMEVYRQVLG